MFDQAKYNREYYLKNKDKINLRNKEASKKYRLNEEYKNKERDYRKDIESTIWFKYRRLKHRLKYKYDLTYIDYLRLRIKQDFKCAICGKYTYSESQSTKTCIDHCHKSGEVRGLLCDSCNVSLGGFKDSVLNLKSAITYLEQRVKEIE